MNASRMSTLLGSIVATNAALFLFGAIQHAGVRLGPFQEPRIFPATIVETICGLSLLAGAVPLLRHTPAPWRLAFWTNIVALSGVVLGMVALALGAGPRTHSNDILHRVMLTLIAAALLVLAARRFSRNPAPR